MTFQISLPILYKRFVLFSLMIRLERILALLYENSSVLTTGAKVESKNCA